MSIFSVIKYPIDEGFKVEDLRRLPRDLLHDWWYIDLRGVSYPMPGFVSGILSHSTEEFHASAFQKLKDRIKNYDNL